MRRNTLILLLLILILTLSAAVPALGEDAVIINKISDSKNNFEFEEGKEISDFYKRRDELCKTEAEIDDLPVSVKIPEKISPSAVEALLDFVSFKEEM